MAKADAEQLLMRARIPSHITATGDIYAQGRAGSVTALRLNAGSDAATAVFRTGGASGTIVWTLAAAATLGESDHFPVGLYFEDGLHVTLTGTDPTVDVVGTSDAPAQTAD